MKKRHILLAILAMIFVLASSIGAAVAYFTTFVTAKGGYVVHLANQTEITEDYDSGRKTLSITNTGDEGLYPVFVRVRAFAGSDYSLTPVDSSGNWIISNYPSGLDSDYWYFKNPIYGKASSDDLIINITNADPKKEWKDGDERNVIVIYESTPAIFTSSGDSDLVTAWTIEEVS